jgi:hypothetical protein
LSSTFIDTGGSRNSQRGLGGFRTLTDPEEFRNAQNSTFTNYIKKTINVYRLEMDFRRHKKILKQSSYEKDMVGQISSQVGKKGKSQRVKCDMFHHCKGDTWHDCT